MPRKKFTDQEKEILSNNPNILKVNDSNVTYRAEFKVKSVLEYHKGKSARKIFLEADINILSNEKAEECIRRWKKIYKNHGEKGLFEETRGKSSNGGRPRIKPLSIERNKSIKGKKCLFRSRECFSKKAERSGRGAELTIRERFEIIHSVSNTLNIKNLCQIAKVSRSGYYYWLKSKENRKLKDKDDFELIQKIFDQKHQKAGWRTIQMSLKNDFGKIMNHKKIKRIKNEYGLYTRIRRRNIFSYSGNSSYINNAKWKPKNLNIE